MDEARSVTVACRDVWKVYGPEGRRDRRIARRGLLPQPSSWRRPAASPPCATSRFEVAPGEVFVVMGLSGIGKSTLVRMLNRLHRATAGQVLIDGEDVLTLDDERLRDLRRHKVSMVFQHFGLLPHRRIVDNVAFGLEVQGVEKDERGRAPRRCSTPWVSAAGGTPTPTSCPAGCSSASGWRARWRPTRRSCCSTSRSARWTR